MRFAATAIIACLAGCSNFHVESDRDSSVDFTTLRDYAWVAPPADEDKDEALLHSEFREAVDRELASKGKRVVVETDAQFLVRCDTAVQLQERANDPYYAYYEVEVREKGRLSIDFLEPTMSKVLWHGTGTADLRTVSAGSGLTGIQPVQPSQRREWPVEDLVKAILASSP
jgi:hypothetical protein